MSYDIVWTSTALERVEAIGDHIALDRPAAARKMVDTLFDAVESVAHMPRRAPAYHLANSDLVRQLAVAPYLVYYRIDDAAEQIAVLTVRHQRQRRVAIDDGA